MLGFLRGMSDFFKRYPIISEILVKDWEALFVINGVAVVFQSVLEMREEKMELGKTQKFESCDEIVFFLLLNVLIFDSLNLLYLR